MRIDRRHSAPNPIAEILCRGRWHETRSVATDNRQFIAREESTMAVTRYVEVGQLLGLYLHCLAALCIHLLGGYLKGQHRHEQNAGQE